MKKALILISIPFFLSACYHEETKKGSSDDAVEYRPLNDTGISTFLVDTVFPNRLVSDPQPSPVTDIVEPADMPGQDGSYGADAEQPFDINGRKGFNFVKLDENGVPLPDQTVAYDPFDPNWSCVYDAITGLMWETKTPTGMQKTGYKYTWYNPDVSTNGGFAGVEDNGTQCNLSLPKCNTYEYVKAINALNGVGLCGYKDWRLPTREELRSILDYGVVSGNGAVMIDKNFFPNASPDDHWTSQTAVYPRPGYSAGETAWEVHFQAGYSEGHYKGSTEVTVRLVRGE